MDVIRLLDPVVVSLKHNDPPTAHVDQESISNKKLNIRYATTSENQLLDIYYPLYGSGPFPTIIFFHGGAFWGGERNDFQCIYALNGIFHGYAVASVDYRLSDEEKFPAAVYDCKASIRFLRAHASEYKLDPDKFVLMGNSAGAYMATMAGISAGNPVMDDPDAENASVSDDVSAIVGLFGVYDLCECSEFADKMIASGSPFKENYIDLFVGLECRNYPGLMRAASPLTYITPACPPTLIQAGTADALVPLSGSINLVDKINSVCGPGRAVLDTFEGARHGDPIYDSAENIERIFCFLDKHLK